MMNVVALAVSVVALGVSVWDWRSMRHLRAYMRQVKRDIDENGIYR